MVRVESPIQLRTEKTIQFNQLKEERTSRSNLRVVVQIQVRQVDAFAQDVIADLRIAAEIQVQETIVQMHQAIVVDFGVAVGEVQRGQAVELLQRAVRDGRVHREIERVQLREVAEDLVALVLLVVHREDDQLVQHRSPGGRDAGELEELARFRIDGGKDEQPDFARQFRECGQFNAGVVRISAGRIVIAKREQEGLAAVLQS